MNKKVKAFTIMEITVAMLITAIVISIAYTAFSIVNQSYRSFQNKNNDLAALIRFDELLRKDFRRAISINKTADGLFIKADSDSVTYSFQPKFAIRTSSIIDTFKLEIHNIITNFEEQPINKINEAREQNRIDELGFDILFKKEIIPYHYHKQYSSLNLIEKNPNALN